MGKCTLCGGKVAGTGKCTECGFDNSKNDKKYRLNIHNTNSRMFKHDSCEDNLNQVNQKKKEKQEQWKQMLEIREDSEAVLSKKDKQISAQKKKEVRKRQQTGTVKKNTNVFFRMIRWIIILSIVAELAGALIPSLMNEFDYLLNHGFSQTVWEMQDE